MVHPRFLLNSLWPNSNYQYIFHSPIKYIEFLENIGSQHHKLTVACKSRREENILGCSPTRRPFQNFCLTKGRFLFFYQVSHVDS